LDYNPCECIVRALEAKNIFSRSAILIRICIIIPEETKADAIEKAVFRSSELRIWRCTYLMEVR